MNNKRYKIVNIKSEAVIYTDFIIDNHAILETKKSGEGIQITKALDISNKDTYKVFESTKMTDSLGNFIYDGDTVEISITVDYKPQGVITIKNGTTIVKYDKEVFEKKEEPLYSVVGRVTVL